MRKFDVTKFGVNAAEQVENMNFTDAEKQILDYAQKVDECEFSDEQYYELAYYFAQRNGLNEKGFIDE
jgi:hypothetical protein